jgi:hypothetical protein
MEKQGVIKPGVTPAEQPQEKVAAPCSSADAIAALDADFRKRAAETVTKAANSKVTR